MQRSPLTERAHGRWRSILPGLGISSSFLTGKHGPCPVCGEGKDRFRFDDKDGRGTWICSHCGAGDGIELVKLFLKVEFREAARAIEPLIDGAPVESARDEPDDEQVQKSIRLLSERSKSIEVDDPVWRYLGRRLGNLVIPPCLRTVDSCLYKDDKAISYHPAMVASVRDPAGKARALHRTYLTTDGRKADVPSPRKVLGKLPPGCAVRLTDPAPVLGIAEGIETALAASILFSIPTWAALNEGRLRAWQPPEGVQEVIIFADNDASFVGQGAAYDLAARLKKTIKVFVEVPSVTDTDWNDELLFKHQGAA